MARRNPPEGGWAGGGGLTAEAYSPCGEPGGPALSTKARAPRRYVEEQIGVRVGICSVSIEGCGCLNGEGGGFR